MRKSRLPPGGKNKFQAIKAARQKLKDAGKPVYDMSIGQPEGPALLSTRKAAAEAMLSDKQEMFEYQDNGSPVVPDFARRFIQAHTPRLLIPGDDLAFLPAPGLKSMMGLIMLACGSYGNYIKVGNMTEPGYPTPADWGRYLGVNQYALPLNPANGFRFMPTDITEDTDLVMANYPHNPTGQYATEEYWRQVCQHCEEHDVRLFNDGAYNILAHASASCTLAQVAVDFKKLSWIEGDSASKEGDATGLRIAALVGSPDFIADLATIKGNTDSGFVAPMAAGVIHTLEHDRSSIEAFRKVYEQRLARLISILKARGMRLAVYPGAGFFTLWHTPKFAFGQRIETAEEFNLLMMERKGIVGVPFEPYIRYSVTGDIEAIASAIMIAFDEAKVSYE